MEFLCAEATARLAYEFPSTMQRWDAVRNSYTFVDTEPPIAEIISLARASDTPKLDHIMPAAFYCCCRTCEIREVFGDFGDQDINFSKDDQKAFILGWDSLVGKQAEETFSWLSEENTSIFLPCKSKKTCIVAKRTLQRQLFLPRSTCIALDPWQPDWERNLCSDCIFLAKKSHEEGRQRIWNELPIFFGLPGWEAPELID